MSIVQLNKKLINGNNALNKKFNKESLSRREENTLAIYQTFLNIAEEAVDYDISEEGLEGFVVWFKQNLWDAVRNTISHKISILDEEIFDNPKGRKNWVSQKFDDRTIKTEFGSSRYDRRYYKNKVTGVKAYLADEFIGIEKRSRVEKGLIVKIAENVKDHSYEKSSKIACCPEESHVSKSTVMKEIRKIETLELPPPEPDKVRTKVKELHIHADEDHIAMQNGKSSIVKCVTICEGRLPLGKNKAMLKGKKIHASHVETPYAFWERVLDDIIERYGNRDDLIVYIHGDGASWIKTGLEVISRSYFVLDMFHLKKYIRRVLPDKEKYPYMNFFVECKIWQYLRHENYEGLKVFLETIAAEDYGIKEDVVKDVYGYLENNRDGITIQIKSKNPAVRKTCTEAQISHVLSDRLSSRPMGWSSKGVEAVVNIRTHLLNGGKIFSGNFKRNPSSLDIHKNELNKLKKSLAPHQSVYNFDIAQAMPRKRDNAWLRDIAKSNFNI